MRGSENEASHAEGAPVLAIGVDIGGTKIAAGVVDTDGEIIASTTRSTPATDPELIESAVVAAVGELRRDHEAVAIGVGAAGFVDADRRTVRFAANLAWRDRPLAAELESMIALPVIVENDANAAGWAEYRFGAARDAHDMLMLTVGTGLGGAIVSSGQLLRGAQGMAGELAHATMVPNGQWCGCGRRGCLEQYTAGPALVGAARQRARRNDPELSPLLEAVGGDPDAINGPVITSLAQAGDEACMQMIGELGSALGQGAASIAAILDPAVIVVGGGVCAAGDLLLEPARRAFDEHVVAARHRPPIEWRIARMGNGAGIIGAADLAREHASSQ